MLLFIKAIYYMVAELYTVVNFCPACGCAALSSPFRCKKYREAKASLYFWYTGRDSNPQPSEPESDALSIEPPVHSFWKPEYYTTFFAVCKGGFWKILAAWEKMWGQLYQRILVLTYFSLCAKFITESGSRLCNGNCSLLTFSQPWIL